RICENKKLVASEALDAHWNLGRLRIPAARISGNCHATIAAPQWRDCQHRVRNALALCRTIGKRAARTRTGPRAFCFEMGTREGIRSALVARGRKFSHEARGARGASAALSHEG